MKINIFTMLSTTYFNLVNAIKKVSKIQKNLSHYQIEYTSKSVSSSHD